ncbi:MAG: ribokinase [Leptolyngbyaceae cyanobacterium SL_5_9]|nr:ribokinase [Leptolyngbyaceae cyanobacterium SL_5_9]
MTVVVFGSVNMDLVARVPRLPVPGETLTGHQFDTIPGGKGANQAVAVARLAVPTQLVGRVGGDRFGQDLIASLETAGVRCDRLLIDQSTTSGVAVIAVDDAGENHIIIIPGANGQVDQTDVERLKPVLSAAKALLLQLEIPLNAVITAAQAAKAAGVTVILDPAPAQDNLPTDLYPLIDVITPNQVEASQLVGFSVEGAETAAKAASVLRQRGVQMAIIKLGKQGALCQTASETFLVPAFPVEVVDTVAAGDAFNGGLAAALAQDFPIQKAVTWGAAVAALSVTKAGAQTSLPNLQELEQFLNGSLRLP